MANCKKCIHFYDGGSMYHCDKLLTRCAACAKPDLGTKLPRCAFEAKPAKKKAETEE